MIRALFERSVPTGQALLPSNRTITMIIDVSFWYTLAALLVVGGITFSAKTLFDHLIARARARHASARTTADLPADLLEA